MLTRRSRSYQYSVLLHVIILFNFISSENAGPKTEVIPAGANVCRSRYRSNCCPGWKLKPGTNLCVLPECGRQCGDRKCIRPNVCMCENVDGVMCTGSIPSELPKNVTNSSLCPYLCLNGGTCDNSTRKCICRFGYLGENCGDPVCKEGCRNGGRCIGPDQCACVYGFAGRKCEVDYRLGPCFRKVVNDMCQSQLENVLCTKQMCCATIGRAWGHPCEHCPLQLDCAAGYLKNIHSGQCVDIDECGAIPGLCDGGKCLNTVGSFTCTCPAGRVKNLLTNVCEDKNECKSDDGKEICAHGQCVNTDGSYFCLCDAGYISSHDWKHCLDARQGKCYITLNEEKKCVEALSMKLSKMDCCCGKNMGKAWGEGCDSCPILGNDEYVTLCAQNSISRTNGSSLMTVDECTLRPGICGGGRCIDTPDAFNCECYPGYQKQKSGDAQVCEDINECSEGLCKGGQCVNSPGSFQCTCSPGFHASSDGKLCIDYNECSENGVCANGKCVNTDGSFRCQCEPGYRLSPTGHACIDFDECLENPRTCLNGRCLNAVGGYRCECLPGFILTSDGAFCVDIDECAAGDNTSCGNGRCINTEGSFRCVCNTGYHLSTNKKTCTDFDECINSPCYNGKCVNTFGSFRCECPHGFHVGTDGRTCVDSTSDSCYAEYRDGQCLKPSQVPVSKSSCCCSTTNHTTAWGVQCIPCPPVNSVEYLELCPHGSGKTFFGEDINECAQNPYICQNGDCENLMGTYRCVCYRGYKPDNTGKNCIDINECDKEHSMCHGGLCKNIPGSYQCICPPGTRFNVTSSVCDDIDECVEKAEDVCKNGKCVNNFGSYTCDCPPNTILNENGLVCMDNRRGSCWTKVISGRCENNLPKLTLKSECCCSSGLAWGSPCELCQNYECNCTKGYAKVDGKVCSDVNECDLNSNLCRGGGTCINTEGSFLCLCPPGLTLDATGTMCQDTRIDICYADFKYGTGASPLAGVFSKSTCCCSTIGKAWGSLGRSERCPGYMSREFADLCPKGSGFVDRKDINECVEFPEICTNGRCKNLIGEFTCTCNPGFTHNENGLQCLDIDECNIMHGVCGEAGNCHNTPGSFECRCQNGYESHPTMHTCTDINECERTPHVCKIGNCVNTVGSYHCECPEGHELTSDRQSCKDIDECSRSSGICSNGICENMLGTYQCICEKGFQQTSGKSHCEDIDECSQGNGGCEDLCVNTPGSYHCDCVSGYFLLPDGHSCLDVDECSANPHICNGGECANTQGSYECSCGTGLFPGANKSTCIDVNECDTMKKQDLCGNGECINTVGSFSCQCEDGYSFKNEDNPYCFDEDECVLDIHNCHRNAVCINNPGSYTCRCLDGFTGNGFSCLDIDECLTNYGSCHKNADCDNTEGSFKCVCNEGFRGDGFSCEDVDECSQNSSLCENGRCVNTLGSYRCECELGYINSDDQRTCIDINECETFDNICTFGKCVNTLGLFRCECNPGYQPDSTGGNCTDVNECDSPHACLYGNCTNNEGSFSCTCPPNYQLADSKNACIDRRMLRCYMAVEGKKRCSKDTGGFVTKATCCCSLGKAWGGGCEQCPTPGSEEFKQLCPGGFGYRPNATTVMLEDVDECGEHSNLCKNGHCTNTIGSYICNCNHGFKLDSTGVFCDDIDECNESSGVCGVGFCVNDEGTYHCVCPDGYMLLPNGKGCVDTRKEQCYLNYTMSMCMKPMSNSQSRMICCCSMGQAWGLPCMPCPAAGSKEYTQLCGSHPGQITNPVTNTTEEIDECALMPQICAHGRCINTPGSFQCVCDPGYIYEDFSHLCIDENECLRTPNPCQGNSRCINSPGTYECQCPSGYKLGLHMNDCTDINECSEQEGICMHGSCENLDGSFRCICRNGYVLNNFGNSCVDIDECQRAPEICKNGTCENIEGSHKCHCNDGFKLSYENDCTDIDECTMMPHLCRNGRCRNTEGSFYCDCFNGYTTTLGGQQCRDVDECTEQGGSCPFPGQCQNLMGSYYCICPDGYRLSLNKTFCEDVDECKEIRDICKGGQCENTNGKFICRCPEGFIINSVGTECIDTRNDECYEFYSQGLCSNPRNQQVTRKDCCCSKGAAWGKHCEECPAVNSTTFEALCPMGVGRGDRGEDLNECVLIPNICQNGECINTDGSFRCDCPKGFVLDASGTRCIDDDECLSNVNVCGNGTCSNSIGSFKCTCNDGFAPGPDQVCEDVNECSDASIHHCSFRCHNTPGSYRCLCPHGFTLTDDKKHCQDVDECSTPANDCKHACRNTVGSYICHCPDGFSASSSPDECEDVNECLEPTICKNGRCLNLNGTYKCECNGGFKPSPDGKQCIDDRVGYCYRPHNIVKGKCAHYNMSSIKISRADCCCTMGAAWGYCEFCPTASSEEYLTLCPSSGYNVGKGYDIDECSTMPDLCANGKCSNTIGSYRCSCNKGYKNDRTGTKCVDINECTMSPSSCQMICENTDGSYICRCARGFTLNSDNFSCRDIDECTTGAHICQQQCINTNGSYECACHPGYRKIKERCIDINECTTGGICLPPGICTNTKGSYECVCPRGLKLDSTNTSCVDEGIKQPNGDDGNNPKGNHNGNNSGGSGTGENKNGNRNTDHGTNPNEYGKGNNGKNQDKHSNHSNGNRGKGNGENQNGKSNGYDKKNQDKNSNGHRENGHEENQNGNQNGQDANNNDKDSNGHRGRGPTENQNGKPNGKDDGNQNKDLDGQRGNSIRNQTRDPSGYGEKNSNPNGGANNRHDDSCKNGKCTSQNYCPGGFTKHPTHNECIDDNECLQSPCGSRACINTAGSYQCVCDDGYFYDDSVSDCVKMEDGCVDSPCTSGCTPLDANDYICGCPSGYLLIGPGHCFYTALNSQAIPNLGDNISTYPINTVSNNSNIISSEGCFSCKINGQNVSTIRSRRSASDTTKFWSANDGNEFNISKQYNSKKENLLHMELTMTYQQVKMRTFILNLQPSSRDSLIEYVIAQTDDAKFFNLQNKNNVWTLYPQSNIKKEINVYHLIIVNKTNPDSFQFHLKLTVVP